MLHKVKRSQQKNSHFIPYLQPFNALLLFKISSRIILLQYIINFKVFLMTPQSKISGFTLIELMIAVGIIGILAGIAIPSYNGYVSTGAASTGFNNAETLRGFEENYMLEMNTYLAGTHTAGAASSVLMTSLNWQPNDKGRYTYIVSAGTTGDIATSLTITVTCAECISPIVTGN